MTALARPDRHLWAARRLAGLGVLVVVVLSPWFGIPSWSDSVAVTALLFGIAATAVNLMLGYGGLLNLGAAFFMGGAAYGEALANYQLHWPLVPAALLSIVFTMAVAALLGLVLVRLPRFYFAVATLGLSVALDGVLAALPNVTGGSSGITHARSLSFGAFTVSSVPAFYVLTLVLVAAVVLAARWLTRGKAGRLLALAREDELAANVLGVDVLRARLLLFVAAAGVLAVAGVVLFPWQGVVVPSDAGLVQSVLLLGSAVVGGMGVLIGGFVGAGVLTWLQTLVSSFGNYESLIYGLAYLAVVFYLNPGIGGTLLAGWEWLWGRLGGRAAPAATSAAAPVAVATPAASPVAVATPARAPAAATAPDEPGRSAPQAGATVGAGSDGLQVHDVRRRFGGVMAVAGVSLSVPRGRVVGLIGANGAGKSTLLNLVSGVEPLDGGRVVLDGADIGGHAPARRAAMGVARTFQTPRLVDEMTVVENIMVGIEALTGRTYRAATGEDERARAMAVAALERVGLQHMGGRRAASLGSGERKFVELLRSLASGPSLLLMDEPGVGLSSDELMTLRSWVRDLAAAGTAVMLVDHNMDFIGSLVDYVYVMEMGRVVTEGRPDEVEMVASRRAPVATAAEWEA